VVSALDEFADLPPPRREMQWPRAAGAAPLGAEPGLLGEEASAK
jgi:hypothetical protein